MIERLRREDGVHHGKDHALPGVHGLRLQYASRLSPIAQGGVLRKPQFTML